jgi:hypothetical protein
MRLNWNITPHCNKIKKEKKFAFKKQSSLPHTIEEQITNNNSKQKLYEFSAHTVDM